MVPDAQSDAVARIERALSRRHDAEYYLRWLALLSLGALSALMLAWFMHYLIQSSDMRLQEGNRVNMLDFVRVKRDEVVQRKDRRPPRPELNKAPDIPQMNQNQADAGNQLAVSQMPMNADVDISAGGIGFGVGEGDYLPIVKVAPIFPQRALDRGIFGSCLVRYTVTTTGAVKDVEVIEDQCDSPLFYRPSVEAALRFKYKPRVIDGVPVEVHGVNNIFRYREIVLK
jgi:protein TonB